MGNMMTNTMNFSELSSVELNEVGGGAWTWVDTVMTIADPKYGIRKIYNDCKQSFENSVSFRR